MSPFYLHPYSFVSVSIYHPPNIPIFTVKTTLNLSVSVLDASHRASKNIPCFKRKKSLLHFLHSKIRGMSSCCVRIRLRVNLLLEQAIPSTCPLKLSWGNHALLSRGTILLLPSFGVHVWLHISCEVRILLALFVLSFFFFSYVCFSPLDVDCFFVGVFSYFSLLCSQEWSRVPMRASCSPNEMLVWNYQIAVADDVAVWKNKHHIVVAAAAANEKHIPIGRKEHQIAMHRGSKPMWCP